VPRAVLVLAVVVLSAAAGWGAWALVRDGGPGELEAEDVAERPGSPTAPATPEPPRPPRDGLPKEALVDRRERFPPSRVAITDIAVVPNARGGEPIPGTVIREALLAVDGLYLRWQSEEAKERFLRTSFRVPWGVHPESGVEGSPLAGLAGAISREGEFFATFGRPPMFGIGFRPRDASAPERPAGE
jgi:hypothetical protein